MSIRGLRVGLRPGATRLFESARTEAAEQPFYPETHVDAVVVPRVGHAINLHRNTDFAYRSVIAWTNTNVEVRP